MFFQKGPCGLPTQSRKLQKAGSPLGSMLLFWFVHVSVNFFFVSFIHCLKKQFFGGRLILVLFLRCSPSQWGRYHGGWLLDYWSMSCLVTGLGQPGSTNDLLNRGRGSCKSQDLPSSDPLTRPLTSPNKTTCWEPSANLWTHGWHFTFKTQEKR